MSLVQAEQRTCSSHWNVKCFGRGLIELIMPSTTHAHFLIEDWKSYKYQSHLIYVVLEVYLSILIIFSYARILFWLGLEA